MREVEKNETENISINDFAEECNDNSGQDCQLSFVKEIKDEKTKKVSYEEIEEIDKSVEDKRDIFI